MLLSACPQIGQRLHREDAYPAQGCAQAPRTHPMEDKLEICVARFQFDKVCRHGRLRFSSNSRFISDESYLL